MTSCAVLIARAAITGRRRFGKSSSGREAPDGIQSAKSHRRPDRLASCRRRPNRITASDSILATAVMVGCPKPTFSCSADWPKWREILSLCVIATRQARRACVKALRQPPGSCQLPSARSPASSQHLIKSSYLSENTKFSGLPNVDWKVKSKDSAG